MLDPITLISLLMLQTQTHISMTARGEQGNVTALLHISFLPVTLWRRDMHCKGLE